MKHMTEQEIRTTDFKTMRKLQEITERQCSPALHKIAVDMCVDFCNAYTQTFPRLTQERKDAK